VHGMSRAWRVPPGARAPIRTAH